MKRSVCLISALAFPLTVLAQEYPTRPITLVVPYTPGTGIDIIARTVGPKISERWGQPVVVENKPGASGNIGAAQVAKARPDGHTMMVTVNTFTMTPALYPSLQYDPIKDFTPTGRVATGSLALVAHAGLPVKDLQQLVTAAKSKELNYSSPGNGTPQHLVMELLKQRMNLNILHVPYKGAAQALTDLLGGKVQLAVLPVHTALPHAKAGKINVIAVSGERRSVLLPDAPSLAEVGLKDFDIDLYFWIAGPARLPREIVQKWNEELASILELAEVRQVLINQGMVPAPSSPEVIRKLIARDIERWKKFIAQTGIKAD